nr:hypothetical protein 30 [Saccharospirillaceae bacterium]
MLVTLELFITLNISGYVFMHTHLPTVKTHQYLDGTRFYFRMAAWGTVFTAPAICLYFIIFFIAKQFPWLVAVNRALIEIDPSYWKSFRAVATTGVISSFIAYRTAIILNKNLPYDYILDIIWVYGTEVQRLAAKVHRAFLRDGVKSRDALIELSLKNGKSYIGIPAATSLPDIQNDHDYLLILPFYSGYRDDKHDLIITTDYEKYYFLQKDSNGENVNYSEKERRNVYETFQIAIYLDEIVTARRFDIEAYDNHFRQMEEDGTLADLFD